MSRAAVSLVLVAALAAAGMLSGTLVQWLVLDDLERLLELLLQRTSLPRPRELVTVPRNLLWVLWSAGVGGLAGLLAAWAGWRSVVPTAVFGLSAVLVGLCCGWSLRPQNFSAYEENGPGLLLFVGLGLVTMALVVHGARWLTEHRPESPAWWLDTVSRTVFGTLLGFSAFWLSLVFIAWKPVSRQLARIDVVDEEIILVLLISWSTISVVVGAGTFLWSFRPWRQTLAIFLSGCLTLAVFPDWSWLFDHALELDPIALMLLAIPLPITALGLLMLGARGLVDWRRRQREEGPDQQWATASDRGR